MDLWADTINGFIDKLPIGIAVFDTHMVLKRSNPVWVNQVAALTNQPQDAIQVGIPVDAILFDCVPNLLADFNAALQGKTSVQEAVELTSAETPSFWHSTIAPLDENGQIIGIIWTVADVTRRQRAEAEAREAKRALLTLMNSLPGMAYRGPLDRARRMELVSDGAYDLTGYPPDLFAAPTHKPFGALIHPEDQADVWEKLSSAVDQNRPFELLYRIRTADNQIKWVLEQGNQLSDETGEWIALEGFISDVTERVLAQQILERRIIDRTHKLSALYEMMAASAESGDLKTNLHHALSWVLTAVHGNIGLLQLYEPKQATLHLAAHVGLTPSQAQQFAHVPQTQAPWHQIMDTGKPGTHPTAEILFDQANLAEETDTAQTAVTETQAYAGLPLWAHNQIIGILNVWRTSDRPFSESDMALMASAADQIATTIDTARLRRNNERLLLFDERNRLARELHDAVTQSLYSLTLFAAANQRAAAINDTDKVQHYSDRIASTAEHTLKEMRLLLHNLRPSLLQNAGLAEALRKRLDAVENRAGVHTRLISPTQLELPPNVEETLFHIAEEALNNALKHASAKNVTVTLSQTGTQINLTIADNGSGFDLSAQTHSGGLGLTSMRERIETLGGQIQIKTQPGETIVSVTLNLDALANATASESLLDLLEEYHNE